MPKVSIIIPVYQSERTLAKCLDSICKQTLEDIEIIIVDDECQDNSRAIVDRYAEKDSRFKIVHLSGRGSYGRAVNIGFRMAKGEYIGIVETDDSCSEKMFETMYRLAILNNADVSCCSYYVITDKNENYEYHNIIKNNIFKKDKDGDYFNVHISPNILDKSSYPWMKIYKREFLIENEIFIQEDFGGSYQDIIFNAEVLSKAKRITGTEVPLYFYDLSNGDSSTNNGETNLLYPLRRMQVFDVLLKNGIFNCKQAREYYIHRALIGLLFFFEKTSKKYKNSYYKKMRDAIRQLSSLDCNFQYFNKEEKLKYDLVLKYPNYALFNLLLKFRKLKKSKFEWVELACVRFPKLIWIFDRVIPKDKNKILFYSSPDFSDNPWAVLNYIGKERLNKNYSLVFIYQNIWWKEHLALIFDSLKITKNVDLYYLYSFRGILNLIRAKFHVINERVPSFTPEMGGGHVVLNPWHGMPVKTIGFAEKGIEPDLLKSYKKLGVSSELFATCDIFKYLMSGCFGANLNRVNIAAQPRNDDLFKKNNKLREILKISKEKKIIFFAPTYRFFKRTGEKNGIYFDNLFAIHDFKEDDFIEFLNENNFVLVFKPHLFDENFYDINRDYINFREPVYYLNDLDLKKNKVTLYELLGSVDLLITDFSSISIDFILTQKPIAYLLSDFTRYQNTRGLCLPDNYDMFFPGPLITNYSELKSHIFESLTVDKYRCERKVALARFHKYPMACGCEQVWQFIGKRS